MKRIAFFANSRGNPHGLETMLSAAYFLSSGMNEIRYFVSWDADDIATGEAIKRLEGYGMKIESIAGKRPVTLGELSNNMARHVVERMPDVDAFCGLTDRVIPLTQYWDEFLAQGLSSKDDGIFWWNMPGENGGVQLTMPIITAKWYKAAGSIFTEYFPFWFDDTWLRELDTLVHGLSHRVIPITVGGPRKEPTKRLRDLRFWMDFFIAKFPERVAHAEQIAKNLGINRVHDEKVIQEFNNRNKEWDQKWQSWEIIFGGNNKNTLPDETYLIAKKRAEESLKTTLALHNENT